MSFNMRFSESGKDFMTRNTNSNNEWMLTSVMHNASPLLAASCFVAGPRDVGTEYATMQSYYRLFDESECSCKREEVVNAPNGSHSEKKRRLTNEQVKSLEMSFNLESKLEPERKNLLAGQLGLHPRQVAIWFQNRRARSKTKQLERDYDLLKAQYEAVETENERLQEEVTRLNNLLVKERISKEENDTSSQVTVNAQEQRHNEKEMNVSISYSLQAGDAMFRKIQGIFKACSGREQRNEDVLDQNNQDKQKSLPSFTTQLRGRSPSDYNALYIHQVAAKLDDGYSTQKELYDNGFFAVDDHAPTHSLD